MNRSVRGRLAAMMFLQYAVWGAWTPVLGATLASRLNATGAETGAIYGALWLACILTPFIGGQLVDRVMPSQVFLAIAHLVGAFAAWMMAGQTQIGGVASGGMLTWMWVWSIFYAPTLGITNSIAFHHISLGGRSEREQERDFAVIRTAGTIGWIVAGAAHSAYLTWKQNQGMALGPAFEEMQITALLALAFGLFSFLLPHTPPAKEAKDPWAFTKAFSLFRLVPGFAAFMLISFIVCSEFQFFYVLSAPFLQDLGVPPNLLAVTKSVSQVAEIVSLAIFLPLSLKYLGMRRTLVIGVLAWPLRYLVFSIGEPLWLVITSLTFHGIGFAFVFVTSQIYVDRVAPKDIRASAQSLLTLVTLGFGNWIGTWFCGWLKDYYTVFDAAGRPVPGSVNWTLIFLVPGILTLLCAVGYALTFREPASEEETITPTETVGSEPPVSALEPQ
jgi:nucleoside transporter